MSNNIQKISYMFVGFCLLLLSTGFSQEEMPPPDITMSLTPDNFISKDTLSLNVSVTLPQGWHINSDKPELEYLIPSRLTMRGKGLEFSDIGYPKPKTQYVEIFKQEVSMFIGTFDIKTSVWRSEKTAELTSLSGQLFFQACSHNMCLPPDSVSFYFDPDKKTEGHFYTSDDSVSLAQSTQPPNKFEGPLLTVILLLIGGGLLLNLTPCVYPLIAITISLFADQGNRSTVGRFFAALLYVLGIVSSFSALGVAASLSGQMFGSALQSSTAQIVIAAVFVLLSLSSFGLFELQLPSGLMGKAMRASNIGGYAGNLVAGLFAGILASPCIGPFILALLIYVAEQRNIFAGVWMFATLAFGMGFPYLFLGMAAGFVTKLPKSGGWMVKVKKLLGLVLLGLAAYYLRGFISDKGFAFFVAALLIFAAIYLRPWQTQKTSKATAILIRSASLVFLVMAGLAIRQVVKIVPQLAWEPYSEERFLQAVNKGQPILLDFESKVWCAACREMEEKTYADPAVQTALSDYLLLKVDVDKHPDRMALSEKWGVRGIPVAIVIGEGGEEKCRLVGFVPSGEFIGQLNQKQPGTI